MSLEPALKIVIPSDSTPSKSIEGNNKKIVGILVALCGLAALGLGYYWFAYGQSRISTDNAYIETDIHSVSSRIMGYVKEVSVKESEVVKKGQLLALLDDSDFSMELIFKKVKLKKAVADFRRAKQLLRAQAISRADFELAEAGMAAAQADVDMTGIKIKYTRIVSPVDGVVGKKNIESGQFAQPGQGLFVILPHGPLWVKGNYKETQVAKVRVGQKVEVTVDAFSKEKFYGHVEGIFPSSGAKLSLLPPENATGNFTKIVQRIPIKIVFDSPLPPAVKAGMSVTAVILTSENRP